MSRYAELLDTSVVAPRDRPEYWSAGIAERFFPMRVDAVSAPTFDARLVGGADRPSCSRLDPGAPAPGRAHERTDQCRRPRMHPALPPDPRRGAYRAGRSQLCAASWRPGLSRHLPTLRLRGPARPSKCSSSACRAGSSGRAPRTSRDAAQPGQLVPVRPSPGLRAPFLASLVRAATDGDGLPDNDGEAPRR